MTDEGNLAIWEDLLCFYKEAGVDISLSDAPVDQFNQSQQHALARAQTATADANASRSNYSEQSAQSPARQSPASSPAKQQQAPAVPAQAMASPETQIALAREAATSATNLEQLQQAMQAFDLCRLKFTAKNICFADGDPNASLMVIGDAPGRDDDQEGIPFVGQSGDMLNRILAAIGLKREDVYLANTLPWRPPGNRPATPLELDLCRPFLDRQIELVAPNIIVVLGDPAAKALTGSREPIYKMRGVWHDYTLPSGSENKIAVMPTLHPDYLLRTPAQKRFAWEDWLMVKQRLHQEN